MDMIFGGLPAWAFGLACVVTIFAGFVKGAVGFAMPLIMIAAFSSFMPPDTALAAMILSLLTTNVHQSLRFGRRAAWESAVKYRRIIATTCAGIVISAPFVVVLPQQLLFALLGVPVMGFALMQLRGWAPVIPLRHRASAEYGLGLLGGLYGGISGIWGPPVIVYLLAIRAEKAEMVRVLGVVFMVGAVVLTAAHLGSGVLDAVTLPLSAALVAPAALGMWLGFRMQDRLDPVRFRRWTLLVLILVALNLLRRAITG
ncbi:sulfite exporter TauE/SafE family protein [Pararhodobacter sp. SW119]|uniref:sulfite exporter TauE/SafE family protein n=1 Tax=Pararhodobacter sp. SW119 TaxID=2780075 RepID=UPI001ADEDFF3|nr:sulfite exporter TauE/SafE family protein [Pararhodobacter sp. SW119]